ncbi:DUF2502 domain-containing protein [uncultured Deefgea sp.]|uniref:DUF2502 domain-containing protein n=1 Tax=uncultured Deefgea sp. TaxID=1304914 RepID=UPI002591E4B1|nr:DUF2502 domain-containing protein [uncultured Deefgea sp.]
MNKLFILAISAACAFPLSAAASINISIGTPVVISPAAPILQLGSRNHRGYYWDGRHWQTPRYWSSHYRYNQGRWHDRDDKRYKKYNKYKKHHHGRDRDRDWDDD